MTHEEHDRTLEVPPGGNPGANALAGSCIGGFEIIQKLGQGGMGAVYQARQPLLNRVVALKVMASHLSANEDFVKRFIREAASAANLMHPNMVQVHVAGQDAGRYYIAMEFVDGESLSAKITRRGTITPPEAVAITCYVAEALKYAWQKARLIHRDIKPDNIFLSSAGEVKVGDLGLAKSINDEASQMTITGVMLGTPHYMSPEQVMADRNVDFRSDIYSLGCTLFHMLTGKTPYAGDSAMRVAVKHLDERVPSITQVCPTCPHHLAKVVTRMMAKKPGSRYQTYEELIAELNQVYAELQKAEEKVPSSSTWAPPWVSRPAVVYAALAVAGILLAAGLFAWSPWKSVTPPAVSFLGEPQVAVPEKVVPPPVPAARGGAGVTFAAEIAARPAEEQVALVVAKLKELNPGYGGTSQHKIEDNAVTELKVPTMAVKDISPVRALDRLRRLTLVGMMPNSAQRGVLEDLSPLRGLKLTELKFPGNPVRDLSPLAGMPLTVLWCWNSKVKDLSPLAGMPLVELGLDGTNVTDLSPLRGMSLRILHARAPRLTDFSPLMGMSTLRKINGRPAAEFMHTVGASVPSPVPASRATRMKQLK